MCPCIAATGADTMMTDRVFVAYCVCSACVKHGAAGGRRALPCGCPADAGGP